MANRIFDLKQTTSTFQIRGLVTGVKGKKFYTSGTTKSNGTWNAIEFGVLVNDKKPVYVKLNGFPRNEVYYYKKGEEGQKGTTQKVAWAQRKQAPGEGFRLIGVNISTGKNEDGQNINEVFTEWDAVEYLHKNLKDGDSVLIRGNVEFDTYTDKDGNVQRKITLVPNQIFYTQEPVDFTARDFKEEALFDDVLVYTGIDKETDENNKSTGRFILTGYSVRYNDIVPVQFILDAEHAKLAASIRKKLKPYNSLHVYGEINVIVDTTAVVEEEDDGWGEVSKLENRRLNSPVRREYIVSRGDPKTIDTETYSEKSIADALKAIKNAKDAVKNFTGNDNASVNATDDDDWGVDDDDDGGEPW